MSAPGPTSSSARSTIRSNSRKSCIDMTDVADYLGAKYGGWYPVAEVTARRAIAGSRIPQGATGGCLNYRDQPREGGGLRGIPQGHRRLPQACQALKKNGTPAGFALGHATGDANGWCQWALWAFGGKVVDDKNKVVIDSPGDGRRARIRQAALRDLHPRRAVVERSEQQQGVPRRRDQPDLERHLDLDRRARTRPIRSSRRSPRT